MYPPAEERCKGLVNLQDGRIVQCGRRKVIGEFCYGHSGIRELVPPRERSSGIVEWLRRVFRR
jgi:hypothetical protein